MKSDPRQDAIQLLRCAGELRRFARTSDLAGYAERFNQAAEQLEARASELAREHV